MSFRVFRTGWRRLWWVIAACAVSFTFHAGQVSLAASAAGESPNEERALQAAGQLLTELDQLSRHLGMPDSALHAAFAEIADNHLDLPAMARSSLSSQSMEISGAGWTKYVDAYRHHLGLGYVDGARVAGPTVSTVLGARIRSDGSVAVIARVVTARKRRDIVLFYCNSAPRRVCEIESDGVRATVHDRRRFARYLSDNGLDALTEALWSGRLIEAGG